jgi:HD-like signal output (HDOD) protein
MATELTWSASVELEPLLVDDCVLRKYAQGIESRSEASALRAHLSVCPSCQRRLLQLEMFDTVRTRALSTLLGADLAVEKNEVGCEGEFYCCPVGLASSSYANWAYCRELRRAIETMAVFPEAARVAVQVLSREDLCYADLDRVACSDPVIAASLVRFANSPLFPGKGVASVGHAIRYVGISESRSIMMGLLMRPWVGGAAQASRWRHSLRVAKRMERFSAYVGGGIPTAEAFLAGLVHDLGMFPFGRLRYFGDLKTKLTSRGWPSGFMEKTIFGFDHADLGGEILQNWAFPMHIANAVRYHHRPEFAVTDLASLLYICEEIEETREHSASEFRLEFALSRVGLAPEHLLPGDPSVEEWASVAAAA